MNAEAQQLWSWEESHCDCSERTFWNIHVDLRFWSGEVQPPEVQKSEPEVPHDSMLMLTPPPFFYSNTAQHWKFLLKRMSCLFLSRSKNSKTCTTWKKRTLVLFLVWRNKESKTASSVWRHCLEILHGGNGSEFSKTRVLTKILNPHLATEGHTSESHLSQRNLTKCYWSVHPNYNPLEQFQV